MVISPAPNPNVVNIKPIMAVIIKPLNTAAGTFLINSINVIRIPSNAKRAGADVRDPKPTTVDGSLTIIPAPLRPINARKNPIPAPIASLKSFGIALRIASLKPETVINKNITLEINTAAKAACQELPIVNIIVYVKRAFIPIPGANPTGYLETSPIIIHAMPDAKAVEKNTDVAGIPPSDNIVGFTPKI